jgi:outer membrane beta-barrel protein
METRIQRIFLKAFIFAGLLMPAPWLAANESEAQTEEQAETSTPSIFEPKVERREVDRDAIDSENWEVGVHYGIISIEDFGASEMMTFSAAYHVTEDFFMMLNYGETSAGETSWERLNDNVLPVLSDSRDYTHYNVSIGYNVLPGEGFAGKDIAFTSNVYVLAGLGVTEFASDNYSTVTLGFGYQALFNDWVSMHVNLKDHIYDIELLGSRKTANDLEISAGLTFFF